MTITISLPTFHDGQINVFRNRGRLNAVRCGRRWGKTKMMVTLAADAAAKGKKAGIFTPEHKQLAEPYDESLWILNAIKRRASKNDGTIRTITGGVIDFWTLIDNELAGRGREYDLVLIDEAAFTKDGQMRDIWQKSLRPTMITRPGSSAWAFSTPNGVNTENFFYEICNDPEMDFVQHYAPTDSNPLILPSEIEREREKNHPLVFKQEFLAEFIDWSGVAFFAAEQMLVAGRPVPYPTHCDGVFAVIDTAVKDRRTHDGTAVSFFAVSSAHGPKLVLLDWDIITIEGAFLETWLPTVFDRLETLARETGARTGNLGAWIEDKVSGTILLQQAANRGWPVNAIDGKITAQGKSERAISVSGYYHQGLFKITQHAFDKTTVYKGVSRNHWLSQVTGFRVGTKEDQADDLLDTFTYGLAIALGNQDGY